jgi:hypothetical protein
MIIKNTHAWILPQPKSLNQKLQRKGLGIFTIKKFSLIIIGFRNQANLSTTELGQRWWGKKKEEMDRVISWIWYMRKRELTGATMRTMLQT